MEEIDSGIETNQNVKEMFLGYQVNHVMSGLSLLQRAVVRKRMRGGKCL